MFSPLLRPPTSLGYSSSFMSSISLEQRVVALQVELDAQRQHIAAIEESHANYRWFVEEVLGKLFRSGGKDAPADVHDTEEHDRWMNPLTYPNKSAVGFRYAVAKEIADA